MKWKKDRLTDKQFRILRKSVEDTYKTDLWLVRCGLDPESINCTDIRLLKAQEHTYSLLMHHRDLLSSAQVLTLEDFQRRMRNRHIRCTLKPSAANAVLNISSKINRRLFKQYKQLT